MDHIRCTIKQSHMGVPLQQWSTWTFLSHGTGVIIPDSYAKQKTHACNEKCLLHSLVWLTCINKCQQKCASKNAWYISIYIYTYLLILHIYHKHIIDVYVYIYVYALNPLPPTTIPEAVPLRSSKCVAFRCKRSFEADTVLCNAATASRNSASCQRQRYHQIPWSIAVPS